MPLWQQIMEQPQPEALAYVDSSPSVTHVSLCAGYGGIDLGLGRAIPSLRTVAFCEIEAFACSNLVAKMEAGLLDAAPIWTNLKTFPWSDFHGKVDILSGGYPCQPFSSAGKRKGKDDPRHLWPFIADGIAAMRPKRCFFENVEGHISLGLSTVISDLEEMGYRTTWGIFSALEVGAPHRRKRIFILANSGEVEWTPSPIQGSDDFGRLGPWETIHVRVSSGVSKPFPISRCALGGVGDGDSERLERPGFKECYENLCLLGNGVVPATATKAFLSLSAELEAHA